MPVTTTLTPGQTPPPSETGIVNAPAAATVQQQSAYSQIEQTLSQYGFTGAALTQLSYWAWQEIVSGNSATQITLDLQQTPQFIARFPAIEARLKAGLPPVTVAQYLSLEDSYEQLERAAGIPVNFASYDQLIAADVSPTEYQARIQQGYQAVAYSNPATIQAFQAYYGISQGQLAAYFLNPTKALPLLEQQATAAQIGGTATMANFQNPGTAPPLGVGSSRAPNPARITTSSTNVTLGGVRGNPTGGAIYNPTPTPPVAPTPTPGVPAITQAQALQLAQMGVTQTQAEQGFQTLTHEQQLYSNMPGQGQIGFNPTTDQLLQAQFGSDGQTQLELQLRAEFEKGTTTEGSGVANTSGGATGAGTVQR